jgi:hypothetical protein
MHMSRRLPTYSSLAACTLAGALFTVALAADYRMTVSRDRLVNAANEPQNWLLMNASPT